MRNRTPLSAVESAVRREFQKAVDAVVAWERGHLGTQHMHDQMELYGLAARAAGYATALDRTCHWTKDEKAYDPDVWHTQCGYAGDDPLQDYCHHCGARVTFTPRPLGRSTDGDQHAL